MEPGLPPAHALDPFRSVSAAWKLLKQAPVTVLIGGLLLGFLGGGGGGGWNLFVRFDHLQDAHDLNELARQVFEQIRPLLFLLIPGILCSWLVFFALSSWITVGFARAVEFSLRTGKDDIAKVFSSGDRFGAMLLARFLSGLIQFASALPIAVGGVVLVLLAERDRLGAGAAVACVCFALLWALLVWYVALGFFFVCPVVAFESCSPTQALSRSWKLARGRRWRLLWFMIVQAVLGFAGVCLCCIGAFVTIPLSQVMHFEAYLALLRGEEFAQWWVGTGKLVLDEHKSQDFSSPPPPPQAPPPLPPQG
ncbi:MAG: glycerophosphoryl diester phosphodiesterase membrane domain-containing protein [Planctomycetes bacterium]|nr:glycerophosphoryl diester phosphodiesterase membrane domain-containing protein [Planctomycetota bacterium]